MKRKAFDLSEIKISAQENPAHRIIKQASLNRRKNNPDKIHSYVCHTYSKTYYDFISNTLQDSLKEDSSFVLLKKFSEKSHLLMMESVSERKFLFPDYLNETVIATKVSGFKHPSFASSATDLQPFSFYNDYFNMLDKEYLNPITSGSTTKYFFNLEDTLYQVNDSVFIISFRPLKGKNFEGMEGVLYINTNGYAIQNVIASPYEKGLIQLKIQQQYQFINNKQWFPEQLNYELHYINYPSKDLGTKLTGRSYITDVNLNPGLRKNDFVFETIRIEADATEKELSYWTLHRKDSLTIKEKYTYKTVDNIGEAVNADKKIKFAEAIATLQLPISWISINLNKIIIMNNYEVIRGGIGLHTNDKLSRWFTIGGYAGYGYKDANLKYGFDAKLLFKKTRKDFFIKYAYSNDLAEAAKAQYFYTKINYYRNTLASKMDFIEQHDLSFNFRALKFLTGNIALNQNRITPTYTYNFFDDSYTQPISNNFKSTEIKLKGRYAYKEKLVQSLGQLISEGSKYPIIHFAYTRSFKTPLYGYYDYNKFSIGIEKTFTIKNIGKTHVLLEGGKLNGNAPYPFLFNGNGSLTKNYLYLENTFQTMGLYEFISDQYANVFLSHNFGSLLYKSANFKPELILFTNAGYGNLKNPTQHQLLEFKTMKKGFFESGLMINNLYKINYLNLVYFGLGGGAFIRYGEYASPQIEKNMAYKLSLTVTF